MHEVLVLLLSQACPGNSVVRLTDRLDMSIAVDWAEHQTKQNILYIAGSAVAQW